MDKINMFQETLDNALHICVPNRQPDDLTRAYIAVTFQYICIDTFCQEFWLNYIDPAFTKIMLKFWNEMRVGKKKWQ